MHRVAWTLLALALVAPLGAAASGGGTFLVEGGILLPQGTDLAFRPLLAYQSNTSSLTDFILRAPLLTGRYYEEEFIQLPTGPFTHTGTTTRPILLQDVEIRMRPDSREGILGFYPSGNASSRLIAHAPTLLEAARETVAASETGIGSNPDPYEGGPYYAMTAEGPHLTFESPGLLLYEGGGTLMAMGPDFLAQGREGEQVYPTGETPKEASAPGPASAVGPVQWIRQWVVLSFSQATIQVDAGAPWVVAAPDMLAEWDGRVVFSAKEGALTTQDARYVTTPSTLARMDGRFLGRIVPVEAQQDVAAHLEIQGDLVDSNLHREAIPLGALTLARGSSVTWGLVVVGAVVGLGGSLAAGRWLLRRRAAPEDVPARAFSVEECMQEANEAADEEDWPRVILWLRRLRVLAPTSARTCADLAHALRQAGDAQAALDLYAEASRLSYDGEADFNGAVLSLEMGRPLGEVEAWLEQALSRTPGFVVDVEGDPVFQRLRGRPRFDQAVAEAWTRTEDAAGGGAPPDDG